MTLAQIGILMCLFVHRILTIYFTNEEMRLGEVPLPKVRQRVRSGLGLGPGPLDSETVIPL